MCNKRRDFLFSQSGATYVKLYKEEDKNQFFSMLHLDSIDSVVGYSPIDEVVSSTYRVLEPKTK